MPGPVSLGWKQELFEKAHGIVWDKESQVGVSKDRCYADETSSTTWDNANVLPSVLALLALAVVLIVQVSHSLSELLCASSRCIFTSGDADIDSVGLGEGMRNLILDFWSTLSEIRPCLWIIGKPALVRSLSAPDHPSGGSGRIETCMWSVTLVSITELTVDLRTKLCRRVSISQGLQIRGGVSEAYRCR